MVDLFKVGDEVDSVRGTGKLKKSNSTLFPWILVVGGRTEMSLTTEGTQYKADVHPSVWHKETGSAPIVGERPIEYPIYKRNKAFGFILEFTGLTTGRVVESNHIEYPVGIEHTDTWVAHTHSIWRDCDYTPPEAKELTVADIEKALGYKVKIVK